MRVFERERESKNVCVCVGARARACVRVCFETERERARARERESVCVPRSPARNVAKSLSVFTWRESVCVSASTYIFFVRLRACVCMCFVHVC